MRKALSIMVFVALLFCMTSCSTGATETTSESTIGPLQSLAESVLAEEASKTEATTTESIIQTSSETTTVSTTTEKPVETTVETTKQTSAPTTAKKVTLTAEQIVQKFVDASLPVSNIVVFDESTDPNSLLGRPNQYTSKANFSDPAHEESDPAVPDNTVEVFSNSKDAQNRAAYVKEVSSAMSYLAQYIYCIDRYVLRLHHDILPSDAAKYEAAFKAAIG